jgi:hypothetical protein
LNQQNSIRPLSSTARRVLTEVIVQLERYDEGILGLCARSEVHHKKYGKLGSGPDEVEHIEERLDAPDSQMQNDMLPLLIDSAYEREELPSSHPNELRIRVTSGGIVASNEGEIEGADLMFTLMPARLVQAVLHPPTFSGIVGLMIEQISTEVLFGYINGVPLPVKTTMRMRSRGVGSFRIDQETVATIHYEPCREIEE